LACPYWASAARADDWPQWLGPRRDGIWRETGILAKFPKGGPPIRWRADIGMGYSGPAVAAGKVFLTDRTLDQGARNPADPFGTRAVAGKERVLCLDAATGKQIWKHQYPCTYEISYPAGPRATPLVSGGKVYTLGAMGDLLCLDATKGKVLWSKNLPSAYQTQVPYWGYAASPLLDGNKLICLVGGDGSTVVAFDKDTGKELWKALSAKQIGYCPPVLIKAGGQRQLIVWHPEAVVALDPNTGKTYWSIPWAIKAGMTIPMPRQDRDQLYFSCFYNGSLMLKLAKDKPAARVLWKGKQFKPRPGSQEPRNTDTLHCVMDTPFIKDGYIYGVCSYGHLRCLKESNGKRLWETLAATGGEPVRWANAFLVPQGDRVFLFNEHGDLIIAELTPKGYHEISRAHILEPTNTMARWGTTKRLVVWSHPAFADRAMFARNDKELVCVDLEKK
jgi:outer membrane protein assembly factor BamB